MPSLPRSETSAWVEVGGSRAEEYSVTHGETQAASCYIEAVQNQEFVIKAVSQTSGVMWTLIVDGEEQVSHDARFVRDSADVLSTEQTVLGARQGWHLQRTSNWCIRTETISLYQVCAPSRYHSTTAHNFVRIALTDDDEIACQEEKIVKHLGSSEV